VSEVDMVGTILTSFTDVESFHHLSLDSRGSVMIADYRNHRILLLNSRLQPQGVLVDNESQVKLQGPKRLCYNALTTQLCVVHNDESRWSDVISLFSLSVSKVTNLSVHYLFN